MGYTPPPVRPQVCPVGLLGVPVRGMEEVRQTAPVSMKGPQVRV